MYERELDADIQCEDDCLFIKRVDISDRYKPRSACETLAAEYGDSRELTIR